MLNFSWIRIGKIVLIVVAAAALAGGVYFFVKSRPVKIAWASWMLDRQENYLDCYGLPFYPQVEKALSVHADIVAKLQSISGVQVGPERLTCKGWDQGTEFMKGDIVVQYKIHAQRLAIEKLIGNNFFGIAYRGKNY